MSENGEVLAPINFDAAARMASRRKWEKAAQKPSTDQSVMAKEPVSATEITPLVPTVIPESLLRTYAEIQTGEQLNERTEHDRLSIRASDVLQRDLEVQGALLSPDHPLFGTLQRVANRIGDAEKKMLAEGELTRTDTSDQYNFFVTKRETVNAFTYVNGKVVYFESGIVSLWDSFLKYTRGYGIAEDHIAALLGHEVSHTDSEAEKRYLNEEYCDVQGLKLTAAAGYNPIAALDLEEFLVWLSDGEKAKLPSDQKDEKEYTFLPSHPDPKNRRLVIINALRNKEAVIPNQAKPMTPLEPETVQDVTEQMLSWGETVQSRVLPKSAVEVEKAINEANNISEVLDALLGYSMHERASVVHEIVTDQEFVEKMTLLQAVSSEIRGSVTYFSVYPGVNNGDISPGYNQTFGFGEQAKYGSDDILIGGLAKNTVSDSDAQGKAIQGKEKTLKELEGIKTNATVISELIPFDSTLRKIHQKEGYEKAEEERKKRAEEVSKVKTLHSQEIIDIVLAFQGTLDLPRLLSGDFSQVPTLGEKLAQMNITNFNVYLKQLQNNFRAINGNPHLGSVLAPRAGELLIDRGLVDIPSEKLSEESIHELLEATKYHRMAIFAHPENRQFTPEIPVHIRDLLNQKLTSIASHMASTPEEQQMLALMWFNRALRERKGHDVSDPYYLSQQLTAAARITSFGLTEAASISPFTSNGVAEPLRTLRISPSYGGEFIKHLLTPESSYLGNVRTAMPWIRQNIEEVGEDTDFVRVLVGEGEFVQRKGISGEVIYKYQLKPRDRKGKAELMTKRRSTFPTVKSMYIDASTRTCRAEDEMQIVENTQKTPEEEFALLKDIAKASEYEKGALQNIILLSSVPTEMRVTYLLDAVKTGEVSLQKIEEAFAFHKQDYNYTLKSMKEETESYQVAMAMYRTLPVSPLTAASTSERTDRRYIFGDLFDQKLRLQKAQKAFTLLQTRISTVQDYDRLGLEQLDEYAGMTTQQSREKDIADIFDFVEEGGIVSFNWVNWKADYKEIGTSVDLVGLLNAAHIPPSVVRTRVEEILDKYKDRYTPFEVNKWVSLMAYTDQPGIQNHDSAREKPSHISILTAKGEVRLDYKNLDDVRVMIDEIKKLTPCSYRDFCIDWIMKNGTEALTYSIPDQSGKPMVYDHPGRAVLDQELMELSTTQLSEFAWDMQRPLAFKDTVSVRPSLPMSEAYASDLPSSYFLDPRAAPFIWSGMVHAPYKTGVHSPLSIEYRTDSKFHGQDSQTIERQILKERREILQAMPPSETRDALMLYALRTGIERGEHFTSDSSLHTEVADFLQESVRNVSSPQAKERLFDLHLRMELGGIGVPVVPESLQKRFPTRGEFMRFTLDNLPGKSAFRDGYIMLASEAYPLSVRDSDSLRSLLFLNDYSTTDENVYAQRRNMELIRTFKASDMTTGKDIRELVIWLVDQNRQVRSMDDFIMNLRQSNAGQKLVDTALRNIGADPDDEWTDRSGKILYKTFSTLLPRVPTPIKRVMVAQLVKSLKEGGYSEKEILPFFMRAGLPKGIGSSSDTLIMFGAETKTFNSLLNGGLDNPNSKELFFEMMLGEKGVVEEPVMRDTTTFAERMRKNFEGSEMHAFLDDVLDIGFRKGGWDAQSMQVAKVATHSLIEGLPPTRRAAVLYNLLSELPKVDFTEPDKQKLRAKLFSVTLSSFGVLGAKLGQIDELIPKGWGGEMATLKHNTKPMPKITVADIFKQEGLSGDYIIESPAGAASTGCGYIVQTPTGEEQFVKVIRPEIKLDWREDFEGVAYMLVCLRNTGLISLETGPIMNQLQTLVQRELQTAVEVENVLQYVQAETDEERRERGGLKAVRMPMERIGQNEQIIEVPADSYMIFEELFPKDTFIELSKLKDPTPTNPELQELAQSINMEQVNNILVDDFFYRSFVLGNWHADMHDGNILVSKEGIVRRSIESDDLILIDFGQTGTAESEERKHNAARLLAGLALYDRTETAQAIYTALEDKKTVSFEAIQSELSRNPMRLQESASRVIAKFVTEEYFTNFMKATVNVLPYLRALPTSSQYDKVAQYMSDEQRQKLRSKLIGMVARRIN